MAQIEGNTSQSGEQEFEKFLKEKGVAQVTIQKLIKNDLKSIDDLTSINVNVDYDDIAQECDIRGIQKVKLKTAIKSIQDLPPIIIDKEETYAIQQMQNKIKSIQNTINLVANSNKKIDATVIEHTNTIKTTFMELHKLLDKRQASLIKKLNDVAKKKKNTLKNVTILLNEQYTQSQHQMKSCAKLLHKAIDITKIEERKKIIIATAKKVESTKVISKNDPSMNNNEIDMKLDKISMSKTIEYFGDISSDPAPILLSLTDNKDCMVSVKYKLNSNSVSHNNNKLKIEWTEMKSKLSNDEKWQYNKEINLNNDNNNINVSIENKTVIYSFRVQYYNGVKWSIYSNIKSISITKQACKDEWNPDSMDKDHFQINGNSIIKVTGGHKSASLKNVVSKGIHIWKFKLVRHQNCCLSIGIWKTKHTFRTNNCYRHNLNSYYTFKISDAQIYKGDHNTQLKYGVVCKQGDVIEMTLDLINCSLSYKINDISYGKAADVEKESYKAAICNYWKGNEIALLSYLYRAS